MLTGFRHRFHQFFHQLRQTHSFFCYEYLPSSFFHKNCQKRFSKHGDLLLLLEWLQGFYLVGPEASSLDVLQRKVFPQFNLLVKKTPQKFPTLDLVLSFAAEAKKADVQRFSEALRYLT